VDKNKPVYLGQTFYISTEGTMSFLKQIHQSLNQFYLFSAQLVSDGFCHKV